ncbi:MAG: hypothetical protein WD871_03380 [Xanthobacteraceae bacterium]
MDQPATNLPPLGSRVGVRAVLVGDRIDTAALESSEALSTIPLAFRAGAKGIAVVFRYGVVVFIGLEPKGRTGGEDVHRDARLLSPHARKPERPAQDAEGGSL